jgi:ribonuclease T
MTDSNRTEVFFCIDIEASGPVPALYNMVSIGAVPVTRGAGEGGVWRIEEERFYVEIKPNAPGFEPSAMAIHGLTRAHLEAQGVAADEAMRRFASFVEARVRDGGEAVFVGHNAVFDWSFIAYYFALYGIPNPFGYKGIDTKSLAMGRLGIAWADTSKETLQTLLPALPRLDAALIHRADYDAFYQAGILCALLNMPAAGRPRGGA